jgi:hypothetical protein
MLLLMLMAGLASARALAGDGAPAADADSAAPHKLKWLPYHAQKLPAAQKVEQPAEAAPLVAAKTTAAKTKDLVESPPDESPAANAELAKPISAAAHRERAIPISQAKRSDDVGYDRLRAAILNAGASSGVHRRFYQARQVGFQDSDLDGDSLPGEKPPTDRPGTDSAEPGRMEAPPEETAPGETTPGDALPGETPPGDTVPKENLPPPGLPEYTHGSESQSETREGCVRDQKDCREARRRLKDYVLSKIDLSIADTGVEGTDFPCECRLGNEPFDGRHWGCTIFTWKAAILSHKPMYFEDVHLERYGHSWNPVLQPFMSGAHFFTSVALLPYQIGLYPPNECIYTLGYYRPGDCAPYLIDPVPLSLRGALLEAGAVTGGVFLFMP